MARVDAASTESILVRGAMLVVNEAVDVEALGKLQLEMESSAAAWCV